MQGRGKWMVPGYKAILYTSLGASMYMMGRLVLVSASFTYRRIAAHDLCRDTRPGGARTRGTARARYPDMVGLGETRPCPCPCTGNQPAFDLPRATYVISEPIEHSTFRSAQVFMSRESLLLSKLSERTWLVEKRHLIDLSRA